MIARIVPLGATLVLLLGGRVCTDIPNDDDSAGDDDDSAGDDDDDSAGDDDDSPDSLAGTWSGPSEGTATVKEQSLVIPCVGFAAVDVDLVDEVNVVVGGHMNCVPVEMPTADPVDIVIPGGFAVGEQGQGDTPLGPVTVSVIQGAEGESLVVTGTGSIVHSSFGPIEVLITAEVHKEPTAGDDDDSAE